MRDRVRRWLGLDEERDTLRREFEAVVSRETQLISEAFAPLVDVDTARAWLGLDGPGGLANVLATKDSAMRSLETTVTDCVRQLGAHEKLFRQIVPQLNDNTITCQRVGAYEQHVPSIRRVFHALRAKAIREQRRKEAEQALAAPPVPAPPVDAVTDTGNEAVAGG